MILFIVVLFVLCGFCLFTLVSGFFRLVIYCSIALCVCGICCDCCFETVDAALFVVV